jgi:transposase
MKKGSIPPQSPKRRRAKAAPLIIGIDLGDRTSRYCVLGQDGEVLAEGSVATTRKGLIEKLAGLGRCQIAIEVGTHSPWIDRLLRGLGHEVIVANARQVQLISASSRKNDRVDARTLAKLARVDRELLRPIRHRSESAQQDLMRIRARAALVEARTSLVNAARGLVKPMGERLPKCDADNLGPEKLEGMPEQLRETLTPMLEQIASLTAAIQASEKSLEQIAETRYRETELLRQVYGVGPLIALTYVLTIEDPHRFRKSRDVGAYVGLRPRQSDSGESHPQLPITKEGDQYLRTMLVQGAHRVLSRLSPDTDLKRWGLELAGNGGKNAKKRAVVAVARKLAVLLHRLWVSGEVYEPLRNRKAKPRGKAAA